MVTYLTLYSELSQVFLIAGVPPGVEGVEGELPRPTRHVATFVWWARYRRQTVRVFTRINFIVKVVTHKAGSVVVVGCNLFLGKVWGILSLISMPFYQRCSTEWTIFQCS